MKTTFQAAVLAATTLSLAGASQLAGAQDMQRDRAERRDDRRDERRDERNREEARLSDQRQQELIRLQQSRSERYSTRLERQQREAEQRAATLQQQNRLAQYQYQQTYAEQLRRQQSSVSNWRSYDYRNDPAFSTAPSYRYSRAGRTYQTTRYGADLLRGAVNQGYQQGVAAGRADRQDNYRRGYQTSYAYQDANYGYTGMYVDQADYNYYFRQGFQRGYQDGFNSRFRYGRDTGGQFSISDNVLSVILNLRSLR
jgi:hypothetical protein